jgi:hypothetical protein
VVEIFVDMNVVIGFNWLWLGSNGGMMANHRVPQKPGIFRRAEQPFTSHELS